MDLWDVWLLTSSVNDPILGRPQVFRAVLSLLSRDDVDHVFLCEEAKTRKQKTEQLEGV